MPIRIMGSPKGSMNPGQPAAAGGPMSMPMGSPQDVPGVAQPPVEQPEPSVEPDMEQEPVEPNYRAAELLIQAIELHQTHIADDSGAPTPESQDQLMVLLQGALEALAGTEDDGPVPEEPAEPVEEAVEPDVPEVPMEPVDSLE